MNQCPLIREQTTECRVKIDVPDDDTGRAKWEPAARIRYESYDIARAGQSIMYVSPCKGTTLNSCHPSFAFASWQVKLHYRYVRNSSHPWRSEPRYDNFEWVPTYTDTEDGVEIFWRRPWGVVVTARGQSIWHSCIGRDPREPVLVPINVRN